VKQFLKLFNIKDAFNIKIGFRIRDLFKVSLGSDNPGDRQRSNNQQSNSNNTQAQPVGGFIPMRLTAADRLAAMERLAAIDEPWAKSICSQLSERSKS
jgi:hypothetical protein